MTYNELFGRINDLQLSYYYLNYGVLKTLDYLKDKKNNENEQHDYTLVIGKPKAIKGFGILSGKELDKLITNIGAHRGMPPEKSFSIFSDYSLTVVKNTMVNLMVELIRNYHFNNVNKKLLQKLNNEDWFLVLTELRNIVSHYNKRNRPITLDGKRTEIKWGNITIKNGQLGQDVKFDSIDVQELMQLLIKYLVVNRKWIE